MTLHTTKTVTEISAHFAKLAADYPDCDPQNPARNVPRTFRLFSEWFCWRFDVNGICDPMYIANVVAAELECGDGCGEFWRDRPKLKMQRADFERITDRLLGSYYACIARSGQKDAARELIAAALAVFSRRLEVLQCACCGQKAPGRQWWNQDTGFGLCPRCCVDEFRHPSAASYSASHGIPGIHVDGEREHAWQGTVADRVPADEHV